MRIHKSIWIFANGFLLASLMYFYIESNYEKSIFRAISGYILSGSSTTNEDSLIIQSLRLTHAMGQSRVPVFDRTDVFSLKSSLIHPTTFDLNTSSGSCGSFATVLSRILTELKVKNRIVQMKVGSVQSGHVIVEAKGSRGWFVIDPSYNLVFKNPDGSFAKLSEVSSNWNWYSHQVPGNYDMRYSYEGYRYTNWGKIPVLMPAIKHTLYLLLGKSRTDSLSLRSMFLQKYKLLFNITLVLYFVVLYKLYRAYRAKDSNIVVRHQKVRNVRPLEQSPKY